jgi:hypothetical protein
VTSPFAAVARKEIRALLPVWAAAALTIVADPLLRRAVPGLHALFPVGIFAYIVGALALGAHAIGHEYTSRTLATLLVQPWKRSSMLLAKTSVLAVMLAALALIAWSILFRTIGRVFGDFPRYPTLLLPLIGGLCVAPYLTMRLRSQMAGVVFTAAIPGVTYLAVLLAGVSVYGIQNGTAEKLAAAVWSPAMLIFSAGGAVLSARSFMRLQAIDGGREELSLPRWLTVVDRQPIRPPLWMLVKKELRLQQMTFALVALYAAIWAALMIAGRLNAEFAKDFPIRAIGVLYFALLPLVMGSIASAQERQLGMLESQAMLPVPSAQQWVVKAGVVLLLALVLGVLLPWFVLAPTQLSPDAVWPMAGAVLLLTTWSLYLSSCSGSAIIALALMLPATAAAIAIARWIDWIVTSLVPSMHAVRTHLVITQPSGLFALWLIVGIPLGAALLAFAARNHRMPERNLRRVGGQMAFVGGLLFVIDALLTVLL